jgi:hypothetical protein
LRTAHPLIRGCLICRLRERTGSLRPLEKTFPGEVRGTADPSASPDFLSRVVASVNCMWFSLERTTKVALVRAVK